MCNTFRCTKMPQPPPREYFVHRLPLKGGWRDASGRLWKVEIEVTYDGSALRCTGLSITPKLRPGQLGPALTKDVLRQLPLNEMARALGWHLVSSFRKQAVRRRRTVLQPDGSKRRILLEGETLLGQLASRLEGIVPRVPQSPRYREVAQIYRAAVDKDQPPTKAVQDHFGVSRGLAATWVHRARKAGYLGQAVEPGKAGEAPPRTVTGGVKR